MVGLLPKVNHRHVTAMALAVLKEKRKIVSPFPPPLAGFSFVLLRRLLFEVSQAEFFSRFRKARDEEELGMFGSLILVCQLSKPQQLIRISYNFDESGSQSESKLVDALE